MQKHKKTQMYLPKLTTQNKNNPPKQLRKTNKKKYTNTKTQKPIKNNKQSKYQLEKGAEERSPIKVI